VELEFLSIKKINKNKMKKTKSIVTVIMVMIVTLIGFTSCHNKKCKDGEKCEKDKLL
jgi:hypothetical protein